MTNPIFINPQQIHAQVQQIHAQPQQIHAPITVTSDEALSLVLRVTSEDESELLTIYRTASHELTNSIQTVVREHLGADFYVRVTYHKGSFISRVVIMANKAWDVTKETIVNIGKRIQKVADAFFAGTKKLANFITCEKISKAAAFGGSITSILNFLVAFFGGGLPPLPPGSGNGSPI